MPQMRTAAHGGHSAVVASGRGIAALPSWTVENYIERGYVVSGPIGPAIALAKLYASTTAQLLPQIAASIKGIRRAHTPGLSLLTQLNARVFPHCKHGDRRSTYPERKSLTG